MSTSTTRAIALTAATTLRVDPDLGRAVAALPLRPCADMLGSWSDLAAEGRTAARVALDVDRLDADQGAEVEAVLVVRLARMAVARLPGDPLVARALLPCPAVDALGRSLGVPEGRTFLQALRAERAHRLTQDVADAHAEAGFRVCTQGHNTIVRVGAPSASADTGRVSNSSAGLPQSYNSGFGATSSTHTLTVSATWARDVLDAGIATIDGLLTLGARPIANSLPAGVESAWTATWCRQGRGTSLVTERGVIVRGAGHTVHGKSLDHAARTLRARLHPAQRAHADRRAARLTLAGWSRRELAAVCRLDQARSAGNCVEGTLGWAERWIPAAAQRGSATVREVISAVEAGAASPERAVAACLTAVRAARRAA